MAGDHGLFDIVCGSGSESEELESVTGAALVTPQSREPDGSQRRQTNLLGQLSRVGVPALSLLHLPIGVQQPAGNNETSRLGAWIVGESGPFFRERQRITKLADVVRAP